MKHTFTFDKLPAIFMTYLTKILSDFMFFIRDVYHKKEIIIELAKRDFKSQYTSSLLGVVWVYLQPISFIALIYFVFSLGFRSVPVDNDAPYSIWLISGILAWFFFVDNFSAGSKIITKYAFLVKKVDFSLSLLPLVILLSTYIPHIILLFLTLLIAYYNGIGFDLYLLQLVYYLFAVSVLLTGLNWLSSSTNLFIPDVSKLVALIIQFGFWLTPIFWNIKLIPQEYHWLINLNPLTYIVNGYRDSMIYKIWFWEKPFETLYFWLLCLFISLLGAVVFKRLRPHFAEVI